MKRFAFFVLNNHFIGSLGDIALVLLDTIRHIPKKPFSFRNFFEQFYAIGVSSFPVTFITALFTGMVMALQMGMALEVKLKGSSAFLGGIVSLAMVKELGPVLTGLIVTARVGSSIAAEIGTMKVTEQIDALITLATNPNHFLVVPRFLAALFALPLLVVFADVVGSLGGALVAWQVLDNNPVSYLLTIRTFVEGVHVYGGLFKGMFFGGIIAIVSCSFGFTARGGAEGVGRATTAAVVSSCMGILISDYFLSLFLKLFEPY